MKFTLREVNETTLAEWDQLLSDSEDGKIFHHRSFLDSFKANYCLFIVYKGTQPKAGVTCLIDKKNKRLMKPVSGIIHDGIFFKKFFVDSKSHSKINSAKFEIINFILNELLNLFDSINFTLVPEHIDIRAFQWVNFYSPDPNEKFTVNIRYTAILNIAGINSVKVLEDNQHFKNLSNSRRQEIRYSYKAAATFFKSKDYEYFFIMYKEMAEKYDSEVILFIEKISYLVINMPEMLRLFYVKNKEDEIVAGAIFSVFNQEANYLYGVTAKNSRERFSGSLLLWEAFKSLEIEGIHMVDLEGVNSPQRGWFKLSFNGELRPYYHVYKPSLGMQ
jgi:hypothetical protein